MAFSASPQETGPTPPQAPGQTSRLFWRWWRKQSPSQQDRYATLGPLVSVLLFLAAIIAAFWYLRNEELEREQEAVKRDTEVVQQQIRMRLVENQEQLLRLARDVSIKPGDADVFTRQADDFIRARPEILSVSWVQRDGRMKASRNAFSLPIAPEQMPEIAIDGDADWREHFPGAEPRQAFKSARDNNVPVYSRPYLNPQGVRVLQLQMPMLERGQFSGTLVTEYALDPLMRYLVPREIAARHAMSLIEVSGIVLTSTSGARNEDSARPIFAHDVVVTPVGNGLILRGSGYRTSSGLIGNTLFWMVVALSVLTVWTLMGTLRHMRRRSQIQKTLVQETNFRRAMENSILTGMRALDMEGRITYVNAGLLRR